MTPSLEFERAHWANSAVVAGLDEAGRGAWAGPVVAAAVVLPPKPDDLHEVLNGVHDSKKLTPARRECLDERIRSVAEIGVGQIDAPEIDRIGIVPATLAAMEMALAALECTPGFLLIDYIPRELGSWAQVRLVRGDSRCLSIAAASIVAKVYRDRMMVQYDDLYQGYGFGRHKGYGTAQHRDALDRLGPTAIHRHSWAPLLQQRLPLEYPS